MWKQVENKTLFGFFYTTHFATDVQQIQGLNFTPKMEDFK